MKRTLLLGSALFLLSSATFADSERSFYAGISGGLAMPNDMLEEWKWEARGQSADLKEEMKNGFHLGAKIGFTPAMLQGFFAAELEYSYQRAEFDKIMSPGFEAGQNAIAGFYSSATDSHIEFHSFFLNLLLRHPSGSVHPYIGFGPGITRASVSFNEANLTTEGFGFAETGDETAFCWQILAGVDFDLSESIAIGAGYRYFSTSPTFTWANGTKSDYDPVYHNFALDMKYRF